MTRRVARRVNRLAPVIALMTGACFATRSDVRILQEDVASVRAEAARADSARAAQIAAIQTMLTEVTDSVRSANRRLASWQGTVQGDLRSIQEQLLTIQELTGQSTQRINELRANMEERSVSPPAPVTPGDTTVPAAAAAGPGPAQLYQLAYDQMSRGSHGAARAGFEELLKNYPTSDLASDAQFYIAETYAAEGNAAAADSVYELVVSKYPRARRAATALYKHGLNLQKANRDREARQAFQKVIDDYPRSDEAVLAREQLRSGGR